MFDHILHVGAHLCEEAAEYELICVGSIIWIEADSELFFRAQSNLSNFDMSRHQILNYFVTDIGTNKIDLIVFNNDGASSSIYRPSRRMRKHWPNLRAVGKKQVRTQSLDRIVELSGLSGQNNLLVLDVQGHELNVLRSGEKSLVHFSKIVCELSYERIYRKAPLAEEIATYLGLQGFEFRNPNQSFHYDGIFLREGKSL
jgi:FkbM family methyltransferase